MNHLLLLAAEEGAHPPIHIPDLAPYITAILVFGVAVFILGAKVWPKILGGLDEREQKIRDEIRAAEEANAKATAALAEYETNLKKAREEASAMIAKAKSDAKTTADELRARNERELADMKERATKDIESARQAAVADLHSQATMLAAAMASKILQREITVDDQQRLIDESVSELAAARN